MSFRGGWGSGDLREVLTMVLGKNVPPTPYDISSIDPPDMTVREQNAKLLYEFASSSWFERTAVPTPLCATRNQPRSIQTFDLNSVFLHEKSD